METVRSMNFVIGQPVDRIPSSVYNVGDYIPFFQQVDSITNGTYLPITFNEVKDAVNFRQRLAGDKRYESCRSKGTVYVRRADIGFPKDPYLESRSRAGKIGGKALKKKREKK